MRDLGRAAGGRERTPRVPARRAATRRASRGRSARARAGVAGCCVAGARRRAPPAAGAQDVACEPRRPRGARAALRRATARSPTPSSGCVVVTTPSSLVSRLRSSARAAASTPTSSRATCCASRRYYRQARLSATAEVDTVVARPAGEPGAVEVTLRRRARGRRCASTAAPSPGSTRCARRPQGAARARTSRCARAACSTATRWRRRATRSSRRLRDRGYPNADALIQREHATARARADVVADASCPGRSRALGRIAIDGRHDAAGAERQIAETVVRAHARPAHRRPVQRARHRARRSARSTRPTPTAASRSASTRRRGAPAATRSSTCASTLARGRPARRARGRRLGDARLLPHAGRAHRPQLPAVRAAAGAERRACRKIGIGEPLDGAPELCQAQARDDLVQRHAQLLRRRDAAAAGAAPAAARADAHAVQLAAPPSTRRSAARRRSAGCSRSRAGCGRACRARFTYQLELGRTAARAGVLLRGLQRLRRRRTRALPDARTAGSARSATRADARPHGRPAGADARARRAPRRCATRRTLVGSDRSQQFNKAVLATLRGIGRLQRRALLAARAPAWCSGARLAARGRAVRARRRSACTPAGPTTVRGFRQNELGPVVYIVQQLRHADDAGRRRRARYYRADAGVGDGARRADRRQLAGRRATSRCSSAARCCRSCLQLARVHRRRARCGTAASARRRSPRRCAKVTPGAGVRIRSPFGAIRIDLGYNPYELAAGAAYYNAPRATRRRAAVLREPGQHARRSARPRAAAGGDLPVQDGGPLPGDVPAAARPRLPRAASTRASGSGRRSETGHRGRGCRGYRGYGA